jgi:hypothetical protein
MSGSGSTTSQLQYYFHLVVYNIRFDGNNNVIADNEDVAPVPSGLVHIDGFHAVCQFLNAKYGAFIIVV